MPKRATCLLTLTLLSGVMCATSPGQPATAGDDPAPPPDLELTRATMCRGVADREPVDPTDQFTVEDGRAYTWCEVSGGAGAILRHVYYHEGVRTDAVELQIRSDRFRTWSYKTLRPSLTGDWRVDIAVGDTVLRSLTFHVAPDPGNSE